jgi:Fur family zinc uptake transcriptional regulator
MGNVQAILDHAESNCRAHGTKLTIKRKQVLSGLIDTQKALSAYELVDYCKEQYGESLPPDVCLSHSRFPATRKSCA